MPSVMTFQVPEPFSIECEESICGALLLWPEMLAQLEECRSADFYSEFARDLFQAMLDLREDGEPVDRLTIRDRLGPEKWARCGGDAFLARLDLGMPDPSGMATWARIVKERAAERRAALAGMELNRQIAARTPLSEALTRHALRIEAIRDALPGTPQTWTPLCDVATEESLFAPYSERQIEGQIKLNLPAIDEAGIFGPESLSLIVARMGVGKTALALQLASHNAISRGIPSGYVSLEMPKVDLVQRLVASRAEVDYLQIRKHQLTNFNRAQCAYAYREIVGAPLYFDDRPALTLEQISLAIRRLRRQHADARLFVVDYISLIERPGGDRERLYQQLGRIAESLKNLARSLGDVAIALVCQLSRRGEQENREPVLSDISDSDDIAKPANAVIAIHRPYKKDDQGVRDQDGTVTLLKNRDGPQARCSIRFDGAYQRFREVPKGEKPA